MDLTYHLWCEVDIEKKIDETFPKAQKKGGKYRTPSPSDGKLKSIHGAQDIYSLWYVTIKIGSRGVNWETTTVSISHEGEKFMG